MSELLEAVKLSRQRRAAIEKRFGFMPLSVLKLHRGRLSAQMFKLQGEDPDRRRWGAAALREGPRHDERVRMRTVGSLSVGSRNATRVTVMPAELVEFFIKYYAQPGDVYLDPFMGQGIQMQTAHLCGLHYYGYDLSDDFFDYISAIKDKIDDGSVTIQITCGDSRSPEDIPDRIGDFSFYSPPYWDIEFYGEEMGQLGYRQTYAEFLDGLEEVTRSWTPKFKPGAWQIVNVGDFRKEKKFYAFHADALRLFQNAGWILHDLWIIEGLVGGLSKIFSVQRNMQRLAPRIHEYALVFRCP